MNDSTTTRDTTIWTIDPAHSRVEFTVRHMMITRVRGRFSAVGGRLLIDEADPSRSRVEVEMEAGSIDTRQPDRDTHLRSPDFLDTEAHPALTFRSTRVEGLRLDPGAGFRVVGELTIRGVTREVTLAAEYGGRGPDPWGGERIAFSGTTTIDRREFGLEWNQVLEAGGVLVGNEVSIDLEVQGVESGEEA